MAHERAALLRAASAIIRRSEFVAFGTWLDAATELLERRMMLHRSASALINRSLRTALNAWVVRADEIADDKRLMRASLSALSGKGRRAWSTWAAACEEAKRREQQVKQALSVLSPEGRARRKAFNTWMTMRNERTRMRHAISSMSRRSEFSALQSWKEASSQYARERIVMVRALSSFMHTSFRVGLNSWIAHVRAHATIRDQMSQVVSAMRHKEVQRAFNHWTGRALDYKRLLLLSAANNLRRPGLQRALHTWDASASRTKLLRRSCIAFSSRYVRRALMTWMLFRYKVQAESTFQDLVEQRTRKLDSRLAAQEREITQLRSALEKAERAATDAAKQAQAAINAAQSKIASNITSHNETLELERISMRAEMEKEFQEELEAQRRAVIEQAHSSMQHGVESVKAAWMRENGERDRQRDLELNQLRLKLGLTNANVCKLLVEKSTSADLELRKRVASPPPALRSLTVRGRMEGAKHSERVSRTPRRPLKSSRSSSTADAPPRRWDRENTPSRHLSSP